MSGKKVKNTDESTENFKRPFNKKKWREQKYSGKAKVQRWDNIKKKQAEKQLNKEFKKLGVNLKYNRKNPEVNKKSHGALKEAQLQYNEIQRKKEERRKEQERIRKERSEAIKAYKEKKALRFRKLSQKTSKGQPLMRTRIELLLEKIQKEYANSNS